MSIIWHCLTSVLSTVSTPEASIRHIECVNSVMGSQPYTAYMPGVCLHVSYNDSINQVSPIQKKPI